MDPKTGSIVTDYETLKAMNANATMWSPLTTMSDNNPVAQSDYALRTARSCACRT